MTKRPKPIITRPLSDVEEFVLCVVGGTALLVIVILVPLLFYLALKG